MRPETRSPSGEAGAGVHCGGEHLLHSKNRPERQPNLRLPSFTGSGLNPSSREAREAEAWGRALIAAARLYYHREARRREGWGGAR